MAALRDSRMVTLVGTGGVGKTRLALQVAGESIYGYDGGVWWVELATVSDPASVPGAILRHSAYRHSLDGGRCSCLVSRSEIGRRCSFSTTAST